MKIARFTEGGRTRLGIVATDTGEILDVGTADPSLPTDLGALLAAGSLAEAAPHGALGAAPGVVGGAARSTDRPAADVPGDRAELRRPRRRERHGEAGGAGGVQQADHLRGRARRRHRGADGRARLGRLRRRARHRHRHTLPQRVGRGCTVGRRRLPDRQRRVGARLAAGNADHDDGQVVGHPRPDRARGWSPPTRSAIRTTSPCAPGSTAICARTRRPS